MPPRLAIDDPVEVYAPDPDEAAARIRRLAAEVDRLKARLVEAEKLADRDPLAPVLNRRAFVRELQRTIAYCQRYGAEAALVFFDLDGFKGVNDRYGHAAGDEALRVVANVLAAHIRESDVIGRLGGDEFGVILAQAGGAAARLKAAQLAGEVAKADVPAGGRRLRVSASFGVQALERGMDAAQMMAGADAAMFRNKAARRGETSP